MASTAVQYADNLAPKYQVVEVDSSIRPARVKILSTHMNHDDATKAWKASAFANIDYYDISHSIIEVNEN